MQSAFIAKGLGEFIVNVNITSEIFSISFLVSDFFTHLLQIHIMHLSLLKSRFFRFVCKSFVNLASSCDSLLCSRDIISMGHIFSIQYRFLVVICFSKSWSFIVLTPLLVVLSYLLSLNLLLCTSSICYCLVAVGLKGIWI